MNNININREIRVFFNTVTPDNVDEIKVALRTRLSTYLLNFNGDIDNEMKNITQEILQNFIVGGHDIDIYMQILNHIHTIAIDLVGILVYSKTIGDYFISACRDLISLYISKEYIRTLAIKNLDNEDENDAYNKAMGKIFNLIIVICMLHSQYDSPNLGISSVSFGSLIQNIRYYYESSIADDDGDMELIYSKLLEICNRFFVI